MRWKDAPPGGMPISVVSSAKRSMASCGGTREAAGPSHYIHVALGDSHTVTKCTVPRINRISIWRGSMVADGIGIMDLERHWKSASLHESVRHCGDGGPGHSLSGDQPTENDPDDPGQSRPWLRWLHFASLVYGVFIEIAPWPCPLTLLEQHLEKLAGFAAYRGPFLVQIGRAHV